MLRSQPGRLELGVFAIALPAAAGGAGGTVAELAAALEQLTESLVPGPVLPTLLAGRCWPLARTSPAVQACCPAGRGAGERRGRAATGHDDAAWLADGSLG